MLNKNSFKNGTTFKFAIVGALCAVAVFIFWGMEKESDGSKIPEEIIRPVKVMQVSTTAFSEKRSFPGLVKPLRENKLAFRVGGPLVSLDVNIGQHVEKGQVIARVDPRDFEVNVTRLKAVVSQAEAGFKALKTGARSEDIARLKAQKEAAKVQMVTAENEYNRQKNLLADKASSEVNYENAKRGYEMAKANFESISQELIKARRGGRIEEIEAAEAGLKRMRADLTAAEHALEDTRLKAPYNGYVSQKFVENFENVRPGEPIVSFIDISSVEVHTSVPEDVVIRINQLNDITCSLSAYPGQQFGAEVKEIGRKTDSANQSYPLTVVLKVPQDLVVTPGMTATLDILLANNGKRQEGYLLPSHALFADPQGQTCVYRIDTEKMTVVKTPVTIGSTHDNVIQVLSGLSSGDQVVVAGAKFLLDNQKVRILNKS